MCYTKLAAMAAFGLLFLCLAGEDFDPYPIVPELGSRLCQCTLPVQHWTYTDTIAILDLGVLEIHFQGGGTIGR